MEKETEITPSTVEWEPTDIHYDESLDSVESHFLNHKTFLERLEDLCGLPKKLINLLKHKKKQ